MTTMTTDLRTALAAWERQPDAAMLTDGTQYAVGMYPAVAVGREDWVQTSPEELEDRIHAQ